MLSPRARTLQGMQHNFTSWFVSRSFFADCTQKWWALVGRQPNASVARVCVCVLVCTSVWAKWQRRTLTMATHTSTHTYKQRRSWLPFVCARGSRRHLALVILRPLAAASRQKLWQHLPQIVRVKWCHCYRPHASAFSAFPVWCNKCATHPKRKNCNCKCICVARYKCISASVSTAGHPYWCHLSGCQATHNTLIFDNLAAA